MASKTWLDGSDNWNTPADWNPAGVPTINDDVTIAQGSPQVTAPIVAKSITNSSSLIFTSAGATSNVATFISNNGSLFLDYGSGQGGTALGVTGALSNLGSLYLGYYGATGNTTLTVGSLSNSNSGAIQVYGQNGYSASILSGSAAGFGTLGHLSGTVSLYGDALIRFASGQIMTIDAGAALTLDSAVSLAGGGGGGGGGEAAAPFVQAVPQARIADASNPSANSALAGLTSVLGSFNLYNGTSVSTTGALTNEGTIRIESASLSTGGGLTNTNFIAMDYYGGAGSALTVNGTLSNSYALYVGNGSLSSDSVVTVAALANSNTIRLEGSSTNAAEILVGSAAGFGTAGILTGDVELYRNALIRFASGQITSIASGGQLILQGANARVADVGATTTNSALTGLASNAGTLRIEGGASVSPSGGLANSGNLFVDYYSSNTTGSTLAVGGTLTNSGALYVGNGSLSSDAVVTAAALSNSYYIRLEGSSTNQAQLLVNSAAGFGTAGVLTGDVQLYTNALIRFASGQITSIASGGQLILQGANARVADVGALTTNSALTGLASNAGTLRIEGGASVSPSGGLANSGNLFVDYYFNNATGSTLTVNGTLANTSNVYIGNGSLTANATISASAVSNNTGNQNTGFHLYGSSTNQAQLLVNSAAGFGTAGVLTGDVELYDNALVRFASGQINTIDGNGQLVLRGNARIADVGALTTNSALTGLASNAGTFRLENGAAVSPSGGLANSGTILVDYYSSNATGSTLAVAGALTNTNNVYIGNSGLSANATISASAVSNNTGNRSTGFRLEGSSTNQAQLLVNSAAGFGTAGVLTGDVELYNNALVRFASGQITAIDGNGQLILRGPNARVADVGATTTNSALTGLASNAGTFRLENGASVNASGAFANSGSLFIDYYSSNATASDLAIGALTNTGNVFIGNSGISSDATLSVSTVSNDTGNQSLGFRIEGSSTNQGQLLVNSAAGFGTAGVLTGDVELYNNALVRFASGQITSIDGYGQLILRGPNARVADVGATTTNSALTGLASNAGTLRIEGGASVSPSGGLTNSGTILLDYYFNNAAGSTLAVGGTLTNTSGVFIGSGFLQTDTTVTAAAFNNSGQVYLKGSSSGQASLTTTGAIANSGLLDLNAYAHVTAGGAWSEGLASTLRLHASGAPAASFSHLSATGTATLLGGGLEFYLDATPVSGATYTFATYAPNGLYGIFNTLYSNYQSTTGDGTMVPLNSGTQLLGLLYNDSLGNIQAVVVDAPASTADDWGTGNGNWSNTGKWSAGLPTFYSDVTIDAGVTLDIDATIDSLAVTAGILATQATTYLAIGSDVTVASGTTLSVAGKLYAVGAVDNGGTIASSGGIVDLRGAITGTGSITLTGGANVELEKAVGSGQTIGFTGATNDTLKLLAPIDFGGTVSGFAVGDKIDLLGVLVDTLQRSGSILTASYQGATVATIKLAGDYTGYIFNHADDGAGGTLITVTAPSNAAPVATNDSYTTAEDAALTVPVKGVLANDTDAEGNALTAALVAGPTHGTLALNPNGSFTYTPSANYNGADSFTYKANDGTSNSNTATVALTISAVNDAPVTVGDSYTTAQNTALTIPAKGVLANDTDVEGSALTAVLVANPAHGTVTLNANGSFIYTPASGYFGGDSFTYRANDGSTNGNVATVALNVTEIPVAHLAVAATTASANEGNAGSTPYTFTVTRSGDTASAASASYAVTGSGGSQAAASDFAGGAFPSGTISFAAGQTTQAITIDVAGDTAFEPNETFALTLSAPSANTVIDTATASATITNDDAAPVARLVVVATTASANEGNAGSTPYTFTVTRSGDTASAASASYAVTGSGGSQASAADFAGGVFPSGTVSFAAGQISQAITVNVAGDTAFEPNETFALTLSAPSANTVIDTATASTTITNDDAAPVARLAVVATTASANEGNAGSTPYTFTVTRSGDTASAASASYAVTGSGGSPAAASDFAGGAFPSGTVSFAAGQTTRAITINVAGDTAFEPNETFALTLSAPSANTVIDTATASAAITNDDAAPGSDTLVVFVSEDAYKGDAKFIVKVDGVQVGDVQTATTAHGSGYQPITLTGDFAPTPSVEIFFVNDLNDGTPATDRNLYVDWISLNGQAFQAEDRAYATNTAGPTFATEASLQSTKGSLLFDLRPSITLRVAEDAYKGDARFIVKVDGVQVGGVQTALASHAAGQFQDVVVHGDFAAKPDSVEVLFINDLYDGTISTDRNLYVDSISVGGQVYEAENRIYATNTAGPTFATEASLQSTKGSLLFDLHPSLTLRVAEDAYQGDATFIVKVDGVQVGDVQTATMPHAGGQHQDITIQGDFAANPDSVTIQFINDLYDGTPATDRNLYVDRLTIGGQIYEAEDRSVATNTAGPTFATEASLQSVKGNLAFDLRPSVTLRVSEDAYQGDAKFIVKVDGVQVGDVQTATASHAGGQYQDLTVHGDFGTDPQSVTVQFLNDLYGGTPATDRNLYVDKITVGGRVYEAENKFYATNTAGPTFATEASLQSVKGNLTFDLGHDTLVFAVAEDAYNGDARFVVKVDGVQIGGAQTVTKAHGTGYQDIVIDADLGPSPQSLSIQFVNDAYGGSAAADRNLYVDKVTINGHAHEAELAHNTAGPSNAYEAALLNGTGTLVFDHLMI